MNKRREIEMELILENISEIIKNYSLQQLKQNNFNLIQNNLDEMREEIIKKYNKTYFDTYIVIGGELFINLFYVKSYIRINFKKNTIIYNKYVDKNNEKLSLFEYPLSIKKLNEIMDNEFKSNDDLIIKYINNRFNEISSLEENWNNEGAPSFNDVVNSINHIKEDMIESLKNKKINKELYFYPTIEKEISIECEENQNDITINLKNNTISFFSFDENILKEKERPYTKDNLEFFISIL